VKYFVRGTLLALALGAMTVPMASAQTADEDPDLEVNVSQPDFNLAALPTNLRLPKGRFAFRVTHRFARPLGEGDFGSLLEDFFGFDSGAQIGLELRYGLFRGAQVGINRTSDRTIQFFGQYDVKSQQSFPMGVGVWGSVDGTNNFRDSYSPALGVVLSRELGEFGAVYVVSGHIAGQTDTMPLRVEKLFQEYNTPGSFAVASVLTLLALVTLFMLVYYKLAGINAFVSIGLNLIILLGFMAYLGAVMTLPGIAGFILTIGMGVDSNVLIFERIREELATNKGARQAVNAGFNRVFITIVDTHVSSLIAAAFLFQFGTGPIRGFATTLFFGLIANVFTAVFVSRTLFEVILSRRPAGSAQQLSI